MHGKSGFDFEGQNCYCRSGYGNRNKTSSCLFLKPAGNQGVVMTQQSSQLAAVFGLLLALTASPLIAAEPVSIQVAMPSLTCGKDGLEPNECILNGMMRLRGAESLNGPLRYFCDVRYSYIAAGNESQAIRFTGRVLFHGEEKLVQGRAKRELAEKLTLKLSSNARQIEVSEIGCERE